MNIDVVLLEDTEFLERTIANSSELRSQYEQTKHLFDDAHRNGEGINEESFPPNSVVLMVVEDGKHVAFVKRLKNGDVEYVCKAFHTVASFKTNCLEKKDAQSVYHANYSGVAFRLFFQPKPKSSYDEATSISSAKVECETFRP